MHKLLGIPKEYLSSIKEKENEQCLGHLERARNILTLTKEDEQCPRHSECGG